MNCLSNYPQNSLFDLKSTTGSSKLKCYHASSNRRVGG